MQERVAVMLSHMALHSLVVFKLLLTHHASFQTGPRDKTQPELKEEWVTGLHWSQGVKHKRQLLAHTYSLFKVEFSVLPHSAGLTRL